MNEIVYVLVNEAMPGYVKIGKTSDLEQRIRSLDSTGVPLPFECFYAATVKDATFVERQLHQTFEDRRVRKNREFFEIAPERVVSALKIGAIQEVTIGRDIVESQDDQHALDRARSRRAAFNFKMVDIPVGSILTFTRNNDVTCTVVGTKQVEFMGGRTSLSAAAQKALEQEGVAWRAVQGPAYWEYEGTILDDLRREIEFSEE